MNNTFSQRIWAGDATTVDEARQHFQTNREDGLIPYAVALYSARRTNEYDFELVLIRRLLLARAEDILRPGNDSNLNAEHFDVLSTHLEWIARHPVCPQNDRAHYRFMAEQLVMHGLNLCVEGHRAPHTKCLLALTMARISMERAPGLEISWLRSAHEWSRAVTDHRQRARVYAKLGFLERMGGRKSLGYKHGFLAVLHAPLVPLNVTAKCVAALLDIE